MEAYTGFAEVYDEFMDNVPYDEWADRFDRLIRKYSKRMEKVACTANTLQKENPASEKPLLVDLGCGTGVLTEKISSKGYAVWGIDLSPDMLTVAEQRKEKSGKDILYICQDMRSLALPQPVPFILSACDCVNYLLSDEDLADMFRSVYSALEPGGLFLFDFNTVHKYRDILGDATIAENRERAAFIWENWYDPDTQINEYDLTLFMASDNESEDYSYGEGAFIRRTETHYQKGYTLDDMTRIADHFGFSMLEAIDADDDGSVRKESERILVVMRK